MVQMLHISLKSVSRNLYFLDSLIYPSILIFVLVLLQKSPPTCSDACLYVLPIQYVHPPPPSQLLYYTIWFPARVSSCTLLTCFSSSLMYFSPKIIEQWIRGFLTLKGYLQSEPTGFYRNDLHHRQFLYQLFGFLFDEVTLLDVPASSF